MPESSSFAPRVGCCGPELGPASLLSSGPWSSQQPGAGLWSQSQGLAVARIAWELQDRSQGEWCRSQTYRDNERELGD